MAVSTLNIECKRYGCMKNLLACYANCRYNTRCEELRGEVVERTEQAAGDINSYLSERGRAPITIQILKRGLKFAETEKAVKKIKKSVEQKETSMVVDTSRKIGRKSKRKTARPRKVVAVNQVERKESKAVVKVRKPRAAFYLEKERASERLTKLKPPRSEKKIKKVRSSEKKQMPKRSNRIEAVGLKNNTRAADSQITNTEAPVERKAEPKKPARRGSRNNGAKKRPPAAKGKLYIIIEGKSASLVDEMGLMSHMLNNNSSDSRYFEAREVEARLQIVPK